MFEQKSRLIEKDRSGPRQCHAAAIALEQPEPHFLLQGADLTAQRRLDDVHASRGAAEVELFGDGDEGAEMAKLHDAKRVSQNNLQGIGSMRCALPQWTPEVATLRMWSPGTHPSARTAVGTVAVAAMLSPLNTSIFPVALPEVQREFGASARASTWLLTIFALGSAVGHPLAGYLADRLGPRRVLVAGLVVTGLSALIAACAATFSLMLAMRTAQALGVATEFSGGIAVVRVLGLQLSYGRRLFK